MRGGPKARDERRGDGVVGLQGTAHTSRHRPAPFGRTADIQERHGWWSDPGCPSIQPGNMGWQVSILHSSRKNPYCTRKKKACCIISTRLSVLISRFFSLDLTFISSFVCLLRKTRKTPNLKKPYLLWLGCSPFHLLLTLTSVVTREAVTFPLLLFSPSFS